MNCSLSQISIPEGVTTIGFGTFYGCHQLEKVYIPQSVASIDYEAFDECYALEDIYFGGTENQWESITVGENNDPIINASVHFNSEPLEPIYIYKNPIDYRVTGGNLQIDVETGRVVSCDERVTAAVIPEKVTFTNPEGELVNVTVTTIEEDAFLDHIHLQSITLPETLTTIERCAFEGCTSLSEICIPASVDRIDEGAFAGCHQLTTINVAAENPDYISVEGVVFDKDLSVLEIYPSGRQNNEYIVPENVIQIGERAFADSQYLSKVVLPDSLWRISSFAFSGCLKLEEICLSDNIEELGKGVFAWCPRLTAVGVSEENEFYCSEEGVVYSKDKTEIILYPRGKPSITYTIPDTVTRIGKGAFYSCYNLETITVPEGVTGIGTAAFAYSSNLKDLILPDTLEYFNEGAFAGCSSLSGIIIPEGITYLDETLFDECNSLKSIYIPDSIEGIGYGAFYCCDELKDVYFGGTQEQWNRIDISEYDNDCLLNANIHYNSSPSDLN